MEASYKLQEANKVNYLTEKRPAQPVSSVHTDRPQLHIVVPAERRQEH